MSVRTGLAAATLAPLAVAAVLAGCGSSSSSSSQSPTPHAPTAGAAKASQVSIAIANYAFKPADLTVKVGTKLTFTNHDSTAHTATTKTPGFDTGTLKAGRSATVTASKPGAYSYFCQFHAFMVAKVTVVQ